MYAVGFISIFVLFALLYRHAYATLELSELEMFDAKTAIAHHLVSAGVGVLSLLVATLAPLELAPVSPTVYVLMGPLHGVYGFRSGRRRAVLEQQLVDGVRAADVLS